MSYRTEEISLPIGDMPLPWLVKPWAVEEDPVENETGALAGSSGATPNARKRSSGEKPPSATSPDPWAAASNESGAATSSQWPLPPATTQGQPQQRNIPSSQSTAHRASTMAILALVGLGLLALVVILVTLAGVGHGAAFSGAHGLHGMAR
jgi:hypothetical protein